MLALFREIRLWTDRSPESSGGWGQLSRVRQFASRWRGHVSLERGAETQWVAEIAGLGAGRVETEPVPAVKPAALSRSGRASEGADSWWHPVGAGRLADAGWIGRGQTPVPMVVRAAVLSPSAIHGETQAGATRRSACASARTGAARRAQQQQQRVAGGQGAEVLFRLIG
ncbi:hypothetical protein ACTIVE_8842 [Actinomadura verrucosospora]|uniref:Uncharacterized protein n=1 Tax=Actinomadura verrucosospora TaxID=46165 RepID=A0A7D4AXG3_ACTVE|nr:hypothetical protein ACTIVE_8842 [Actinomadura verrucosospora]